MFEFAKNFWKEMFNLTKTWSIRKQMLVCYLVVMIIILFLILIVVVVNIYILRMETVKEIDKTLDEQAEQNILQLVKETGILMHSQITQVGAMFELVQNMIYEMQSPDTYSLAEMLSYKAEDLPEKCWVYTSLSEKVCMTFSSYFTLTNKTFNQNVLDQTSSLDNIWPSIWKLTSNVALRYHMYLDDVGFVRNFPGTYSISETSYQKSNWLPTCTNKTSRSNIASTSINDPFGTHLKIINVGYPLFLNQNNKIGCIVADLPLNSSDYILNDIYSVKYLKTGFISIVHNNGTIMDNAKFWGVKGIDNPNIETVDKDLWKKLKEDYLKSHFFIHDYEIYRIAGYPLTVSISESSSKSHDNWDYMVLLIVEESDIMKYRNESKDKLENASIMLIIITLTCSVITIAVVTVLIHFLAKSITSPLKGIIEFTNKINAKATEKDMVTKEELDQLKEGDDQVAELVRTFKELAGSLIMKKEEKIPKPFQVSQNRVFPRNELYQKNKIDWKKLLESLSE